MEFVGKSKKEAIELGLKELNITEDEAVITVIEEAEKGLFGKIKKMAKVDIALNMTDGAKTVKFLEGLFNKLNVVAKAKLVSEGEQVVIDLIAEDSASLIGYRGEILDSIQTLAGAYANIGKKEYKRVVVNCEGYREKREETLISLAHKLEDKATRLGKNVTLEPMNPYERRIIHSALINSEKVKTASEGKEPNRYVVIIPNEKKVQKDRNDRPYNKDRKGGKDCRSFDRKPAGDAPKRKSASGFGTFLGNSKDLI
jgi:spoIIIJ-associated protein